MNLEPIRRRLGTVRRHRAEPEPPWAADQTELGQRRRRLSEAYTLAQWDLGGLVYEMARRDHFRMDLLVKQAAALQDVDAELGEVERLLRLEQAAAAGTCSSCGALYAPGATFCWKCGESLVAPGPVQGSIASP